jgi:TatD DNase family protein
MKHTFTDTHAHIYSKQFNEDRDAMLERTFMAGVQRIYMPNIDHSSIDGMLELEERYPEHCFAMMGLHPCSVKADFEKELYIVEQWLAKRHFVAIGEMGIDLYWDKSFYEHQREAFLIQARWAVQYKLPLVIHCREAMPQTLELLESIASDDLYGVLHCFTGTLDDARRLIAMNFRLGIGGVVSYKNGGLDQVVPHIELKHLLLETDSPYLAPVPHRGKRNETSYLPLIAARVAELSGNDTETIADITTRNALDMFRH